MPYFAGTLFTPSQPTINNSNGKVSYSEVQPEIILRDFIYCYWQLKTNELLKEDFIYRVAADGCMDIFWEAENPNQNFITGFSREIIIDFLYLLLS